LWGATDDGSNKVPLVAWDHTTNSKLEGGLDFDSFEAQGRLLKLQNISKLLGGYHLEWVWIMEEFIWKGLRIGPLKHLFKDWTIAKIVLLMPQITLSSKTARALLQAGQQYMRSLLSV
jgi:hypothetical protein